MPTIGQDSAVSPELRRRIDDLEARLARLERIVGDPDQERDDADPR